MQRTYFVVEKNVITQCSRHISVDLSTSRFDPASGFSSLRGHLDPAGTTLTRPFWFGWVWITDLWLWCCYPSPLGVGWLLWRYGWSLMIIYSQFLSFPAKHSSYTCALCHTKLLLWLFHFILFVWEVPYRETVSQRQKLSHLYDSLSFRWMLPC